MNQELSLLQLISKIEPETHFVAGTLKEVATVSEVVIGRLGEFLQKLYCVRVEAIKARDEAQTAFNLKTQEITTLPTPPRAAICCKGILEDIERLRVLQEKTKDLEKIFRHWILYNYPEARDKRSIAIRKDWSLVYKVEGEEDFETSQISKKSETLSSYTES